MMTEVEKLAVFIAQKDPSDFSQEVIDCLKIRVLDSLGCAIGALQGPPILMLQQYLQDLGGNPLSSLIGGGKGSPDRAAFYNSALIRYLDFNDSYLAKGETCHPSDNIGAILSAADYADATGLDFLVAVALAYQIQCRLSDEAPVRAKGFDHTTQGAYAAAGAVAKILGLDEIQIANAIAISGTCNVALRVTRTGELSHWKGLAYPNTAFIATHSAFLAKAGIQGPREVFEGDKGFMALSGPFQIDWKNEALTRVLQTIIKKYNAEIHSQSALEGALELQEKHQIKGEDIERIEIDIFDVAYHIIGGGEEGDKTIVSTKEEADHSLHYMIAVALLDRELLPRQFDEKRINLDDVQELLKRVHVRPNGNYTSRFPDEMACQIIITLKSGESYSIEKKDYEGFRTRPISWESALNKYYKLTEPYADKNHLRNIADAVDNIETIKVRELTTLLAKKEKYHV